MGLLDFINAALSYNKRVSIQELKWIDAPGLVFDRKGNQMRVLFVNSATATARDAHIPIENDTVLLRDLVEAYEKIGVPKGPIESWGR
jgi:hypothetical protein